MRIILEWLDQLRQISVSLIEGPDGKSKVETNLSSVASALVAQLQAIAATANTWAAVDHNPDGSHEVVRVGGTTSNPAATTGRITIFADGNDLKVVKPDGTVGTITVV